MRKEFVSILVCMLLITVVVSPVVATLKINNKNIENESTNIGDFILQPPKQWDKTYGGANTDGGRCVQQTTDGGFIIAGWTDSSGAGGLDVWLIKTDGNGNQIWAQTYGGTQDDWANSVYQTSDGGFIVTGATKSYGPGTPTYTNMWLIRTDGSGIKQWDKVFGGVWDDEAWTVEETIDGGYCVIGSVTWHVGAGLADFWLIKTNSNGIEQWNVTFGGTDDDVAFSGHQTSDGGYVLAGGTQSYGQVNYYDVWIVKTDSSGSHQWDQTFGPASAMGRSVQETNDGGYIITGYNLWGLDQEVWLIKTDSNGNEQWNTTFGGSQDDQCFSVQQTIDGGYILAGWTESYGAGGMDVWLIKTDGSGNKEWDNRYGGIQNDQAFSVKQTNDGGYILAGRTASYGAGMDDVWLIKITSSLKWAILLGRISNLNTTGAFSTFTAVRLLIIQFSPFQILVYNLGESVTVSNQYIGILTQNFAIGLFNAAI